MRLRGRVPGARWAFAAWVLFGASLRAEGEAPRPGETVVFAATDDADDDGVADGVAAQRNRASTTDLRLLAPLTPGRGEVRVGQNKIAVSVVELVAVDAHGRRVDLASSHASISRVLPAFLSNDDAGASDEDALRWIAVGDVASVPSQVEIVSLGPKGQELDVLPRVELWELPCPPNVVPAGADSTLICRGSPLIRATADHIDRAHPESKGRSLRAEVGGRLVVRVRGKKAAAIRVGGPRGTVLGDLERYRARLRVHVLRVAPAGGPSVGDSPKRALELVRREVDTASLLWGQCGIHFGPAEELWVRLEDPPPAHLLAVGCDLGFPASGGSVRFRIGKKAFSVATSAGETPLLVASRVASALEAQGFSALVSRNPRIEPGALETADVLVRRGDTLVELDPDGDAPLSSDASLSVCIGGVHLADGLAHFTDHDAVSGTLEERSLVKAYADRDPTTIEVFVIPAFSGASRVGESFLDGDGSGVQNTVIVDRAAIQAGARSHVLSHELGHILLDMPGHPDDYGVDQPSALMDADATDPSIFGPRRLSVGECERALRQRGPSAPLPLLELWPLYTRRK